MKTIKKTIRGIEYIAQWQGLAVSNEQCERCKVEGTDRLSTAKIADIVFNEVIISPKVNADDFEDISEFNEVLDFGKSVIFGTFEAAKSKSALKREVEMDWLAYKLIFCDMANYTEDYVFNEMTPQQIEKANIALEIVSEQIKKVTKNKSL